MPYALLTRAYVQEKATAALPGLEASVTQLEADKAVEEEAYEGVMSALHGETEGLRKAMEAKQRELAPLSDASAACVAAFETNKTELRLLQERAESSGKEVEGVRTQVSVCTARSHMYGAS